MKKSFLSLFALTALISQGVQANASVKISCDLKDIKTGYYHSDSVKPAPESSAQQVSEHFLGDTLEIEFTRTMIATYAGSSQSIFTPFVNAEHTPVSSRDRLGTMRITKKNEEVVNAPAVMRGYVSSVDNPQNVQGGSAIVVSEVQAFDGLNYMPAHRVLNIFLDNRFIGFVGCTEE